MSFFGHGGGGGTGEGITYSGSFNTFCNLIHRTNTFDKLEKIHFTIRTNTAFDMNGSPEMAIRRRGPKPPEQIIFTHPPPISCGQTLHNLNPYWK